MEEEKRYAGGVRQEVEPIRTYDYERAFGAVDTTETYPEYYKISDEYLGKVKDQGSVGACVACVISSLTEVFDYIERIKDGEKATPQEFSEGWAYGALRSKEHNQYGMFISEALEYWRKVGVIPKKYFDLLTEMPDMRKKVEAMSSEYYDIAENYRIKSYVSLNYANLEKRDQAIKKALTQYNYGLLAGSANFFFEGHCIMLVGWNDKNNTYIFKNSWGTNWKNGGFSEIPKNKIDVVYLITDEELSIPFNDVTTEDWFYSDVKNVYLGNLMKGITQNTFAPLQSTTRAEMATLINRLIELFNERLTDITKMFQLRGNRNIVSDNYLIKPVQDVELNFTDVASNAWYYEDIKKINNLGLIKGTTETTFEPEKGLTRAEMATFLNRVCKLVDEKIKAVFASQNIIVKDKDSKTPINFSDVQPEDWYYNEIVDICDRQIMQGISAELFEPDRLVNRAEIAAIINRTSKYIDKKNCNLAEVF